eukprot:240330-Pelagomonas_calceolata.AAC.8
MEGMVVLDNIGNITGHACLTPAFSHAKGPWKAVPHVKREVASPLWFNALKESFNHGNEVQPRQLIAYLTALCLGDSTSANQLDRMHKRWRGTAAYSRQPCCAHTLKV